MALSDGTFGMLIAAQNGDIDRLRNVFQEYRREPPAAPAATPASKPVSYVTTKSEKPSQKPKPMGKAVDRRDYSEQTRAPTKETKICRHFVAGKCFNDHKCCLLHDRAAHE